MICQAPSKTKTLRLNQFVGSDKPKMDDFNYDNTQLETLVGGHLDDTEKHLTPRRNGKSGPVRPVSCTSMTAMMPPSAVSPWISSPGSVRSMPWKCRLSVNDMSTPSVSLCYHAAAGQDGKATVGIALSGKTLTVYNDPDLSMAQTRRKLNAQGISYVCQLFR